MSVVVIVRVRWRRSSIMHWLLTRSTVVAWWRGLLRRRGRPSLMGCSHMRLLMMLITRMGVHRIPLRGRPCGLAVGISTWYRWWRDMPLMMRRRCCSHSGVWCMGRRGVSALMIIRMRMLHMMRCMVHRRRGWVNPRVIRSMLWRSLLRLWGWRWRC